MLLKARGDAAVALNHDPSSESPLDISDREWRHNKNYLVGLLFRHALLHDCKFASAFVECQLHDSRILRVNASEGLTGGGSTWENCEYSSVFLNEPSMHRNRFIDCQFNRVTIHRLMLCDTVFTRCRFKGLLVEGITTRRRRNIKEFPELVDLNAGALFEDCVFEDCTFRKCNFDDVAFQRCTFANVHREYCRFVYTTADEPWWNPKDESDPNKGFVREAVLTLIGLFGRGHPAVQKAIQYESDYLANRNDGRRLIELVHDEFSSEEIERRAKPFERLFERVF